MFVRRLVHGPFSVFFLMYISYAVCLVRLSCLWGIIFVSYVIIKGARNVSESRNVFDSSSGCSYWRKYFLNLSWQMINYWLLRPIEF